MHKTLNLAAAASVCALALGACGGGASSASAPAKAGVSSKLTASEPSEEHFAFSKKTLTATAGKVSVDLSNPGSDKAPHAIAIEGNGVDEKGQIAQPGSASRVTADLKPGTYTFYCPVGDHREEGMEGKLVVR